MRGILNLFFFVSVLFLIGCPEYTDVPISYSKKLTDSRVIGYWQDTDSTALQISKNSDGIASLRMYQFNKISRKYESKDPNDLFFVNLTDKSGTLSFASYGKDKNFSTLKFSFNGSDQLLVHVMDEELFKNTTIPEKDDVRIFETTQNFRNFVKKNMRKAAFYYESPNVYYRRETFASLLKPKIKDCSKPIYRVVNMQSRQYNKNLNVWDDFTEKQYVYDEGYTIRFYSQGISLKLADGGFDASDFSFHSSRDGWNRYSGILKQDGRWAGSTYLAIFNKTYSELTTGGICDATVQIAIDDVTLFNLFDKALNGSDKFEVWLELRNY